MNLHESATVEFKDLDSSDDAIVIVRYDREHVALTRSLRSNGDSRLS
jgi:hypothetical protein